MPQQGAKQVLDAITFHPKEACLLEVLSNEVHVAKCHMQVPTTTQPHTLQPLSEKLRDRLPPALTQRCFNLGSKSVNFSGPLSPMLHLGYLSEIVR